MNYGIVCTPQEIALIRKQNCIVHQRGGVIRSSQDENFCSYHSAYAHCRWDVRFFLLGIQYIAGQAK